MNIQIYVGIVTGMVFKAITKRTTVFSYIYKRYMVLNDSGMLGLRW